VRFVINVLLPNGGRYHLTAGGREMCAVTGAADDPVFCCDSSLFANLSNAIQEVNVIFFSLKLNPISMSIPRRLSVARMLLPKSRARASN
jgi:hypothetical protein